MSDHTSGTGGDGGAVLLVLLIPLALGLLGLLYAVVRGTGRTIRYETTRDAVAKKRQAQRIADDLRARGEFARADAIEARAEAERANALEAKLKATLGDETRTAAELLELLRDEPLLASHERSQLEYQAREDAGICQYCRQPRDNHKLTCMIAWPKEIFGAAQKAERAGLAPEEMRTEMIHVVEEAPLILGFGKDDKGALLKRLRETS